MPWRRPIERQRSGAAEIGCHQGQITNDQAGSVHLIGLDIFGVGAVVADMRIGQRDDLLAVAGVSQDFLVAGHGGVEHHLTDSGAGGSDGIANIDRAVCERQNGGRGGSLERQKHWFLRVSYGYAQARSRTILGCSVEVGKVRERRLGGLFAG